VLLNNSTFIEGSNTFTVNAITQEIVDYGAVLAYVKNSIFPNAWFVLPAANNGQEEISLYAITLNEIIILSDFPAVLDLKLVIIAGNSTATSKNSNNEILSSLEKNGIDVNNYSQLAEFYNLEQ
jgi:hypothetical protein